VRIDPLKVLYLLEDFNIGGLERIVETIYNELDRNVYDPHIGCIAAGGNLADQFLHDGKSLQVLNLRNYHNPANIFRLSRYIRQGGFAIVHTHAYFAGTMGRIAAFLAGTPAIIHHVHTTYWDFKFRNMLIERFLSGITDRIICCSDFVRSFVVNTEKISSAKTLTIYNGVKDDICVTGIPKEADEVGKAGDADVMDDVVRLAVVASLVENKGHQVLLTAFRSLAAINPKLELLIIGDGPLRGALEETAREFGVASRVIFTGLISDVPKRLTDVDIVVLPSIYREGLGISLIEAMCLAKPVVTTAVGGNREVVDEGVNGFLVPPGDAAKLAAKLKVLIEDQELRKRMGGAGRLKYEEKFTERMMIEKIENLYASLLSERHISLPGTDHDVSG